MKNRRRFICIGFLAVFAFAFAACPSPTSPGGGSTSPVVDTDTPDTPSNPGSPADPDSPSNPSSPGEPAPTPIYGITLSETSIYSFTSAIQGYGTQDALTVTVTNTGNQATGALAVALSGANAGSFTLSTSSVGSISIGGTSTFTVRPNNSLLKGEYSATVTVSGGNGISAGFPIAFTVLDPGAANFSVTDNEKTYSGGSQSATVGYAHGITEAQAGTITVFYTGTFGTAYAKSTTAPTDAGTYKITVNTTGGPTYDAVSDMEVETLRIDPAALTITGFNITRPYNGTDAVTNFGSLSFSGLVGGQTATVNTSGVTATYARTTIGTGISISWTGSFGMSGGTASASNYTITQPASLTGAITLATPGAPNAPGEGSKTATSVTLTAPTGGDPLHSYLKIEYSRSNAGSTSSNGAWQDGLTFTGLSSGTAYSFFARYKADSTKNNVSTASTGKQITTTTVLVTGVTLNKSVIGLNIGATETLTATIAPSDASNKNVTWASNTPTVATVSDGVVTGVSLGRATITVTTADGGKTAVCTVTVDPVIPEWARTVSTGSDFSRFWSVAVDSSGNVYAAGYQKGTGTFTYGTGVSAQGTASMNAVLVKYNSSGTAQWARTVSAGSYASQFYSVAVDSSGNVYTAGEQNNSTYTFGTGVSVQGEGPVLVKYNSSGAAQWARSQTGGIGASFFNAVAVDSSGNVYAAGRQLEKTHTYGTGVSVQGTGESNVVLVKYNSSGTAQWARSVSAGSSSYSEFHGVAVDSSGNVYAVGRQQGTGTFTYGTGVSVQGTSSSQNVVLVKYNSSGTAQWARSVSVGSSYSMFSGVAVDSSGNVYAVGNQEGTGIFTYGTGVSAQGTGESNVVLVKYNSSGTAQWARTASAGTSSWFSGVAVDSSGNVYAVGNQQGTGTHTYGTGVSAQGTGGNVVLVKYNSSGTAQWARTASAGSSYSMFSGVAVDSSGNVYAVGNQQGTGTHTYGTGVSAQGTGESNVVLVKYRQQ